MPSPPRRVSTARAPKPLHYFDPVDRHVHVTRSKTFNDGHTMSVEVGRAAAVAYAFVRATTGYTTLRLGELSELDRLDPALGWDSMM